MLGTAGQAHAIGAHVVLLARERDWPVLTSDPDDLLGIDPTLMVPICAQLPSARHGSSELHGGPAKMAAPSADRRL